MLTYTPADIITESVVLSMVFLGYHPIQVAARMQGKRRPIHLLEAFNTTHRLTGAVPRSTNNFSTLPLVSTNCLTMIFYIYVV